MTGNRIWRVETPSGPAVQKLYGERAGSLRSLGKTAVSHARRGADIVAPSAMMDGQVGASMRPERKEVL